MVIPIPLVISFRGVIIGKLLGGEGLVPLGIGVRIQAELHCWIYCGGGGGWAFCLHEIIMFV